MNICYTGPLHLLQLGTVRKVAVMKKILTLVIALVAAYFVYEQPTIDGRQSPGYEESGAALENAIRSRRADYQVQGNGTIVRVLPDDTDGSRHQRFIVRLDSGHTVLIAHNIDLAPRVADLKKGGHVVFFGVYEWNERGGVIHWTHHDPGGHHIAGWIEYEGRRYQ